MKISRLFQRTIFGIITLFGLIGISTSILSIDAVDTHLTQEYESNSRGIAKTIADASVDILLNRDLSALQSLIDQFIEVQGISYIYVKSETGEVLAHTFVPGIPDDIRSSPVIHTESIHRTIVGEGDFVEVSSPILAGAAGSVHIGMDLDLVSLKIQNAIGQQIYLISGVFFVGIFAAIWLINLVSKPIDQLEYFAARLARRQVEDTDNEPLLDRKDVLGDLARLFLYFSSVTDFKKADAFVPPDSQDEPETPKEDE